MKHTSCIVIVLISSFVYGKHPIHLTAVNMEIKKKEMRIDFSIRLFKEDYTYLVTGVYHDELAVAKKDSTIDAYLTIINNYIGKSFKLSLDGIQAFPEFTGQMFDDADLYL